MLTRRKRLNLKENVAETWKVLFTNKNLRITKDAYNSNQYFSTDW